MAKLKYKKIASLDYYPRSDRFSMTFNLMTGKLQVSYQGRDAKEDEIGTALWKYHGALNEAEAQIEALLKIVRGLKAGEDVDDEEYEYEESMEEDGDEDIRYQIDEFRSRLFQAMHQKDDQAISYWLNHISVVEEKLKQNASHETV